MNYTNLRISRGGDKEMLRYNFKNNGYEHYVKTNQKMSEIELKTLGQILASFPHADNRDWPKNLAKFKSDEIPKKLLLLAANAYDCFGNTVLGIAAENGRHVDALQRLIDMGANINMPDDNMNKLPLHWAINNKLSCSDKKSYEAVKVVKCLLDNGARADITCYQNTTPFEYANSRGFKAAVNLLSEEALTFRKQQNLLVFGLFSTSQSSLKILSGDYLFDRNTVKIISDLLRPKQG